MGISAIWLDLRTGICDEGRVGRSPNLYRPKSASGGRQHEIHTIFRFVVQYGDQMTDPLSAFIDFMHSVDCPPDPSVVINPDDKMHRFMLSGDKPKTQNGSYILRIDPDGFAVGGCMNFRDQVWHKWHVKTTRTATDADRAAWKAKQEAARVAHDLQRAADAAEAATKAGVIWSKADRSGSNAYLERKGFTAEALGCRMSRGSVVVPMYGASGLCGLQFIYADGDKLFIKGCAKEGSYHAIKGEGEILVIGEGMATMAAVHAALGCAVIVAFDAGNLKPVAQVMRKKYPEKRIVFAADADLWTIPQNKRPSDWDNPTGDDPRWVKWREDGRTVNTGADKAMQAAVAIGGATVVSPPIPADDAGKRTDWWDYRAEHGDEAVRACFEAAMNPPAPPPPEDDGREWEPDYEPQQETVIDDKSNPLLKMVRPLGRNGKTFYFFPRTAGQIMDFTGPSLANVQNLVTMAPLHSWNSHFGGGDTSEKKMASAAANALIEECNRIGIYNADRERGVGVWVDQSGPVFNSGDRLYHGDGVCSPADFQSKSVYVMGARVGALHDDPLNNADGGELLAICLALSWKSRPFGYILAGWIVAAMVGGALRWRPHTVLTGEKGAGKTWVLENIIKPSLGSLYLERDGGTTEAKLRQDLGGNARPLIMDEAESETLKERVNMEAVLALARKASTGAAIGNANGLYYIRSCFMFSAINPRIIQGADLDRNTIVQLVKDRHHDSGDRFKALQMRVRSLIGEEFSDRLLARSFAGLPVLLKNIETFSDVIAMREGSKRFGDQFGTLIACAFSLTSQKEVTREFADDWCGKHDWKWATEDNEQSDPERLVEFIISARIRYDERGVMREGLVGSLIDKVRHGDMTEATAASLALGQHAIKVENDMLLIGGPCQPMSQMLKDTSWGGNYRRTLGDLNGAEKTDKVTFSPMLRVRAVAIPLSVFVDAPASVYEEELPFGDWE